MVEAGVIVTALTLVWSVYTYKARARRKDRQRRERAFALSAGLDELLREAKTANEYRRILNAVDSVLDGDPRDQKLRVARARVSQKLLDLQVRHLSSMGERALRARDDRDLTAIRDELGLLIDENPKHPLISAALHLRSRLDNAIEVENGERKQYNRGPASILGMLASVACTSPPRPRG